MKHRIFLITLICVTTFMTACSKKDACESVTCQNGSACVDGTCECSFIYAGSLCEKETRSSYYGEYSGTLSTNSGSEDWFVIVSGIEQDATKFLIDADVHCVLTGRNTFVIPEQNDIHHSTISGSGTITASKLEYTINVVSSGIQYAYSFDGTK